MLDFIQEIIDFFTGHDTADVADISDGGSTSVPDVDLGPQYDEDHDMFHGNPFTPPDLDPSYGGADIEFDESGQSQITQPEQRVFENPDTGDLKPESETGVGGNGWTDTGTTTDDYSDNLGQYPSDPNEH